MHNVARLMRLVPLLLSGLSLNAHGATLLSADFDADEAGFSYVDDPFLGTQQPGQANGVRVASGGYAGSGGLQVTLGGADPTTSGSSGGWNYALNLASATTGVSISFRYKMQIDAAYRYDQHARVMVTFDGATVGRGSKSYVDHLGGSEQILPQPFVPTTDWQQAVIHMGDLAAGTHALQIGAYNNRYGSTGATTLLVIDDVVITDGNAAPSVSDVQTLVNRLDLDRYKQNIETLSAFGDRCRMCGSPSTSYFNAQAWVAQQLSDLGYTVEHYDASFDGGTIYDLYVTKVGTVRPDQMYIVSAHLDGRGGGGAADDDGSGVSLLMEMARVLSSPDVRTDISVRLIFWDAEENGTYGSRGYVSGRQALQGIESPVGSGLYPEPTWLGIVQHDMLMYDHGVSPVGSAQSEFADLDVEWYFAATPATGARQLAQVWQHLSGNFAAQYPATAYNYSSTTDDTAFRNACPSISVRENRRQALAEWANPHWHKATDLYANYSAADFLLAFNAVQTTLGTVGTLTNAHLVSLPDGIFSNGFD